MTAPHDSREGQGRAAALPYALPLLEVGHRILFANKLFKDSDKELNQIKSEHHAFTVAVFMDARDVLGDCMCLSNSGAPYCSCTEWCSSRKTYYEILRPLALLGQDLCPKLAHRLPESFKAYQTSRQFLTAKTKQCVRWTRNFVDTLFSVKRDKNKKILGIVHKSTTGDDEEASGFIDELYDNYMFCIDDFIQTLACFRASLPLSEASDCFASCLHTATSQCSSSEESCTAQCILIQTTIMDTPRVEEKETKTNGESAAASMADAIVMLGSSILFHADKAVQTYENECEEQGPDSSKTQLECNCLEPHHQEWYPEMAVMRSIQYTDLILLHCKLSGLDIRLDKNTNQAHLKSVMDSWFEIMKPFSFALFETNHSTHYNLAMACLFVVLFRDMKTANDLLLKSGLLRRFFREETINEFAWHLVSVDLYNAAVDYLQGTDYLADFSGTNVTLDPVICTERIFYAKSYTVSLPSKWFKRPHPFSSGLLSPTLQKIEKKMTSFEMMGFYKHCATRKLVEFGKTATEFFVSKKLGTAFVEETQLVYKTLHSKRLSLASSRAYSIPCHDFYDDNAHSHALLSCTIESLEAKDEESKDSKATTYVPCLAFQDTKVQQIMSRLMVHFKTISRNAVLGEHKLESKTPTKMIERGTMPRSLVMLKGRFLTPMQYKYWIEAISAIKADCSRIYEHGFSYKQLSNALHLCECILDAIMDLFSKIDSALTAYHRGFEFSDAILETKTKGSGGSGGGGGGMHIVNAGSLIERDPIWVLCKVLLHEFADMLKWQFVEPLKYTGSQDLPEVGAITISDAAFRQTIASVFEKPRSFSAKEFLHFKLRNLLTVVDNTLLTMTVRHHFILISTNAQLVSSPIDLSKHLTRLCASSIEHGFAALSTCVSVTGLFYISQTLMAFCIRTNDFSSFIGALHCMTRQYLDVLSRIRRKYIGRLKRDSLSRNKIETDIDSDEFDFYGRDMDKKKGKTETKSVSVCPLTRQARYSLVCQDMDKLSRDVRSFWFRFDLWQTVRTLRLSSKSFSNKDFTTFKRLKLGFFVTKCDGKSSPACAMHGHGSDNDDLGVMIYGGAIGLIMENLIDRNWNLALRKMFQYSFLTRHEIERIKSLGVYPTADAIDHVISMFQSASVVLEEFAQYALAMCKHLFLSAINVNDFNATCIPNHAFERKCDAANCTAWEIQGVSCFKEVDYFSSTGAFCNLHHERKETDTLPDLVGFDLFSRNLVETKHGIRSMRAKMLDEIRQDQQLRG